MQPRHRIGGGTIEEYLKALVDVLGPICRDKGVAVETHSRLAYRFVFETNDKHVPLCFTVDILVRDLEGGCPLVAVEAKKELTTHDVIIYSSKALEHKNIYPFLRYGLVLVEAMSIPRRFFVHNRGFDFAVAVSFRNSTGVENLRNIVGLQIEQARAVRDVAFGIGTAHTNFPAFWYSTSIFNGEKCEE